MSGKKKVTSTDIARAAGVSQSTVSMVLNRKYNVSFSKETVEKVEKAKDKAKPALTERESFDAAADVIYAILRSNGRAVTWEEAMCLVPPDPSGLEGVLNGFQEEVEKYHKKKAAKTSTMPKQSR